MKSKPLLTIGAVSYSFQIPFGVLKKKGQNISVNEKPIVTENVSAGVYVLNKKIMKHIKKNSYMDMDELINKISKTKNKINIHPIYENWLDLGRKEQLKNFNIKLYDK